MKFTVEVNQLQEALNFVETIFEKGEGNVTFRVQDGEVAICSTDMCMSMYAELNAKISDTADETFGVANQLLKDALKFIKSTKKEEVEIEVTQDTLKFDNSVTINKMRVRDPIKNMFMGFTRENCGQGGVIKTTDLLVYIDSLLPLIDSNDRDGNYTRITFNNVYVYAVPVQYVACIENRLLKGLTGFTLSAYAAKCIKKVIKTSEYFCFDKVVVDDRCILLTIATDTGIFKIPTMSNTLAFDIAPYLDVPKDSGFVVDRELFQNAITINKKEPQNIKIKYSTAEMAIELAHRGMSFKIPITQARGDCEGNISLPAEILNALIFRHTTMGTALYFYLDKQERGTTLMCGDNSGIWKTIIKGIR